MKIAIVDDDLKMAETLKEYLKRFMKESGMPVMEQTFSDARQLLSRYDHTFDLILLDVEMPGMNGIEAAKKLRMLDDKVMIMFITNMAQYAIHGYEVEAVDYVLKPVEYPDFSMKMQKVLRYFRRDRDRVLMLETSEGRIPVKVSQICYIEVIRHYLHYHTALGVFEVRGVMKTLNEELKAFHFARCSQSYLVNLAHVTALRGNTVVVGSEELPVSRNRKTEFVDAFTRYVGGMSQI